MWEDGGISRGYGFVRFGDEDEMRRAKYEMQGSKGLGLKAIRCSIANPKGKNNETSTPTTTETTTTADPYSQPWSQQYDSSSYQYYQQYYNYYGYYPQYNYYQQNATTQQPYTTTTSNQYTTANQYVDPSTYQLVEQPVSHYYVMETDNQTTNDHLFEDPNPPQDYDALNEIFFVERSGILNEVLGSHWQPLQFMSSKDTDEVEEVDGSLLTT